MVFTQWKTYSVQRCPLELSPDAMRGWNASRNPAPFVPLKLNPIPGQRDSNYFHFHCPTSQDQAFGNRGISSNKSCWDYAAESVANQNERFGSSKSARVLSSFDRGSEFLQDSNLNWCLVYISRHTNSFQPKTQRIFVNSQSRLPNTKSIIIEDWVSTSQHPIHETVFLFWDFWIPVAMSVELLYPDLGQVSPSIKIQTTTQKQHDSCSAFLGGAKSCWNCIRSCRQYRGSSRIVRIERRGRSSAVDVADEIYHVEVGDEFLSPDEIQRGRCDWDFIICASLLAWGCCEWSGREKCCEQYSFGNWKHDEEVILSNEVV